MQNATTKLRLNRWVNIMGVSKKKKEVRKDSKKQKYIRANEQKETTDNQCPIWIFSDIDRDGKFAFDVNRSDFEHRIILEKIIEYATMTWNQLKQQTHDESRNKNHFLTVDRDTLTDEALKRVKKKIPDEDDPRLEFIFSFALTNLIRVIGIRSGAYFYVMWYDPRHEFSKTKRNK